MTNDDKALAPLCRPGQPRPVEAKVGFTKGCADRAKEMGNVNLVRYEKIISADNIGISEDVVMGRPIWRGSEQ